AFALGAPHYRVVISVMWRAARGGIVTGILLAVARAAGETAPLLFTSLGNSGWSFSMSQPMASLPVTINQYAGSPAQDWV
ncbi:ABC transporter permease subunit, partial [Mycobacterium tuberculosis]|nr:ABC transporter permease subunit [Mycobacterium tuberculosis]